MSLFQAERRDVYGSPTWNPFENPAVPLQSVAFDSVYGLLQRQNNESGEVVTVDKALAIPTVWRCIGLLSTVVAGCPLNTYNKKRDLQNVPCLDPFNPATTYTQYELWELVVAHLCLWGNAFVRKVRNNGDMIVDLLPIPPALVQVQIAGTDDAKNYSLRVGEKFFKVHHVADNGTILPDAEIATTFDIMHIAGQGYDGIRGLSPLQVAAQTYGTALAADKLAARFYGRGTMLSGILNVKAPLADQEQADEIKRRWREVNAGAMHGGDIAVLDAETSYQQLTIPPDQLQFLESREWEACELARIYGIPPHLIGDESKSTSWGTGIEQQNIGFVAYTVAGWTSRIEQRVTREIVNTRGQYSAFDLTALMKGSTSERFTAYALGIQWGWITRNEVRAFEDMPPIDGLDKPLIPLNMAPHDWTGNQPPAAGITVPDAINNPAPAPNQQTPAPPKSKQPNQQQDESQ